MRDHRDAKTMAHSLREALADKAVTVSHSECLELVAKSFGVDTWNILSAKIEADKPPAPAGKVFEAGDGPAGTTVHCSFCGKAQHDVETLIAGPSAFICNECVGLCTDIVDDGELAKLLVADRAAGLERLRQRSTETLAAYVERQQKAFNSRSSDLAEIAKRLGSASLSGTPGVDKRFEYLNSKTRDELLMIQKRIEIASRITEATLEAAQAILAERKSPRA